MILPFFLALFAAIFGTVFFPGTRILAFVPFFGLCYMHKSFISSLWIATLCGIILDLLCTEHHFGLYALVSCLATTIMYHQKRHFFDDKPLALSIYTLFISMVVSILQLILFATLSWKLIFTDVIGMSFFDALYAFLWFTCPIKAYDYIHKEIRRFGWKDFFLKRLKTDE